ncbi:MAG TPA: NnrS family protein [Paracoccaceae bacterium]|nr:NnrS family protein [Paracoccaceae bacterium]
MATISERMRAWTGPAILSHGFRPFFLGAGLWAVLAMGGWLAMLAGALDMPTEFDPVAWHVHEFLFGYLGAVLAGFLLTAVPNWTGRLPVTGWPLGALAALWLAGRGAVAFSALLPGGLAVALDLAFPAVLIGLLWREITAGRNWRNLPVLGLMALFLVANAAFHAEGGSGGLGQRGGIAVGVMLIALIGGRILPSFTRNWLAQRGASHLPTPPGRADAAVLALTAGVLVLWTGWPGAPLTAGLAGVAGLAHLWRLSRWQGHRTGAEPLVWVLHLAYAMLALGFWAVAAAGLGWFPASAVLHVWTAGAIGLKTLAVMTRASLGHAGLPLHATPVIASVYLAILLSVLLRLAAGVWPGQGWLLHGAALAWMAGFGTLAAVYWPVLTRPRAGRRSPGRA